MAVTRSDQLEQRRSELAMSLARLGENRDRTYRLNSDALARDRAGVKQEQAQEMTRLGDAEVTADAEIRAAQRELREIDSELALLPRRGLGSKVGGLLRRTRTKE